LEKLTKRGKELKYNAGFVLCVSGVRWEKQGGIRGGEYTVCYSRGERAGKGVAIVLHKRVLRRSSITSESFFLR